MLLTVPTAQEIVIRLAAPGIEAASAQTGSIYPGVVNAAILVDGKSAIPPGAAVEIEVANLEKPGRKGGKLDLSLKSLTVHGHKYPIASDSFELTAASKAKRGGKFGVIGALAGGVAHGVKGAVAGGSAGAGAGAAGAISELDVAPDSLLTFHLSAPLTLTLR
jgi:hypothetical protein